MPDAPRHPACDGTLPEVAIILVNWNGRADTLECLESVFRLDYPNFRVVVCDNASGDGSIEAIEQWWQGGEAVPPQSAYFDYLFEKPLTKPAAFLCLNREAAERGEGSDEPLVVIEAGGNLGFAGGNNVAIRHALHAGACKYFWLLNTDTVVEPDALRHLVDRAERDQRIGIVGSSLVYYWQPDKLQGMGGASMDARSTRMQHVGVNEPVDSIPADPSAVERRMAYVIGASMLVSREFIEQVGLMCEDYFLYYEEIDWALRGKERFELAYAPASIVYHKVGGSSRKVASLASMRFLYRNRLKFVARFLPERYIATLWSITGDMLRAFLKGRFGLGRVIVGALLQARRQYRLGRSGPADLIA